MKKIILGFFMLTGMLVVAGLFLIQKDMQQQLNSPLSISTDTLLVLAPGQSLKSLARMLVDNGWLSHPYYLRYEGQRQNKAASLKTGEYDIPVGTTPLQLLDILVAGKVRQYSMTIPEGWTFSQIMQAIRDNPYLEQTLIAKDSDAIMTELGLSGHVAEGRVFPDTYFFPAGTSDRDFLLRAIKMQDNILQKEWQARDTSLPYKSAYEALIMASIIEKETALAEERAMIAGVFVRRLQLNMKLQTDPTVIYAMADSFDGDIRRKDLSIDSPYNTYLYKGLPPTPIASPGQDAIKAALQPAPGKALYFVARGDGSHYFSESLAEHNKAVVRYQLKKR